MAFVIPEAKMPLILSCILLPRHRDSRHDKTVWPGYLILIMGIIKFLMLVRWHLVMAPMGYFWWIIILCTIPDTHYTVVFFPQDWCVSGVIVPPCGHCGGPRSQMCQVYCPLEGSPYHRTLHLLACCQPGCWNRSDRWELEKCHVALPQNKCNILGVTKLVPFWTPMLCYTGP